MNLGRTVRFGKGHSSLLSQAPCPFRQKTRGGVHPFPSFFHGPGSLRTGCTKRESCAKRPLVKSNFRDFLEFVREQGIVGLAVGLVLGVAVKGVVDQLVESFVNPIIGMIVGDRGGLEEAKFTLTIGARSGEFAWGKFVSVSIQFVAVCLLVYGAVRLLKVNRDDVKEMSKESAKG